MGSITTSLDLAAGVPTLTFSETQDGAGIRYIIMYTKRSKLILKHDRKHLVKTHGSLGISPQLM